MRDRSIRIALGALLATTALASPAKAQSEAPYRNWDENGVDLVKGDLELSFEEGSIGSGLAELSLVRVTGGGQATSQWDRLYFRQTNTGGVLRTVIGMPDGSAEIFTGASFTNTKANGGTLAYGGPGYIYISPDGTQISFAQGQYYAGPSNFCGSEGGGYPCDMLPETITYPDGRTVTLGFFVRGQAALPPTRKDFTWRLMSIQNSFGYSIFFGYQSSGPGFPPPASWYTRSKADFKRDGVTQGTVNYTYPTGAVDIADFSNNVWRVTSTSIRRPGEATPFFQANGVMNVTSVTNNGVTTNYNRVVNGNTVTMTVTKPLSQQTVVVSDLATSRPAAITDALNRTTSYQYDTNGRMTHIIRPEGNFTQFTYDDRGNITETRNFSKTQGTPADIVTTASFDATCTNPVKCNKPNSRTDARGNTTDYTYDPTHGGVTSVTLPAPTAGAVRPQARYTYTQQNGEYLLTRVSQCQTLASCTDAVDETRTSLTYDVYGNVLTSTSGSGDGTLTAVQTMTYDAKGDLLTVDGPLTGADDTTRLRYDAARRRVGAIAPDPDGAGALKHRAIRTTYRPDGQVSKRELGTVNSQSDPDWAAFASAQEVQTAFDSNARPVQSTLASGGTAYSVTQLSYDALGRPDCQAVRMTYVSLPGSACTQQSPHPTFGPDRISQIVYDAAGQVTELRVAVGTADAATERTLTYTSNGRLQTLKDAESNLTTYEYDGFDRLKKTRFPVTTQGDNSSSTTDYEELTYDPGGNVTNRRLRDNQSIGYTYDNLNRLTVTSPPNPDPTVNYGYDNLGRLTSAAKPAFGMSLSFTYDALSRNLTQTGPHGTICSNWDVAGRRTRLVYAGACASPTFYMDYDYLVTGEMTKIRENGATSGAGVLATFGYDDLGRRASITRGNGALTTYGYDPVSRLQTLTDKPSSATWDQTVSLAYNPASQIVTRTGSNDSYAWTGHGSGSTASVADGLNRFSSIGGSNTGYDARGNLISDPTSGKAFTYWPSDNALWTVSSPWTSMSYDPLGRLAAIDSAGDTSFAYDGLDMIAEYDGAGTVLARYVHGPGMDEPLVRYDGSGTSNKQSLHADERGSITALSYGSPYAPTINRYDEYGKPQPGNIGRFQYTGQMWLSEAGLYHYKARAYSPTFGGRFLQTDPIGYEGGINLYAYVGNDPVNFTDPLGLCERPGQRGYCVKPINPNYGPIDAGGNTIVVRGDLCRVRNCGEATSILSLPTSIQGGASYIESGERRSNLAAPKKPTNKPIPPKPVPGPDKSRSTCAATTAGFGTYIMTSVPIHTTAALLGVEMAAGVLTGGLAFVAVAVATFVYINDQKNDNARADAINRSTPFQC